MADPIGSMTAVVRATASAFDADLKQCSRSVDSFQSHLNRVKGGGGGGSSGGLGGLLGGFTQGVGIGAGLAAFNTAVSAVESGIRSLVDTIHRTDQIDDFAKSIGATAAEISAFGFAASLSGSSAETFEAGIQKMVQHLGEARAGSEEAGIAFKSLGLDVNTLAGKSPGEAFKDIAEAFKAIPNPADRAAIAMELFGKQGVGLVGILSQGRAGIEELVAKANELGVTLGGEQVGNAARAQNAINELSAAWQGFKNVISDVAAGAIFEVSKFLSFIIGKVTSFIQWVRGVEADTQAATGSGSTAENPIGKMKRELEEQKKLLDEQKKAEEERERIMRRGADVAKSVRTPLEILNDTIADLTSLLNNGAIGWETFSRAIEKANKEFDDAIDKQKKMDKFGTPSVGGFQRGTTAEFVAVQAAQQRALDIERRQEDIQRKQLQQAERGNQILQDIRQRLSTSSPIVGADI